MKPYNASLNALIDAGPADWVRLLAPRVGLTPGPAEPVDTDLSVTAQSDMAFRLVCPPKLEGRDGLARRTPHRPEALVSDVDRRDVGDARGAGACRRQRTRPSDPTGLPVSVYSNATRYALQRVLLKLGRKRFGPYPPEVEDAVENLDDDELLCDMIERVIDATGWDDLFSTPSYPKNKPSVPPRRTP